MASGAATAARRGPGTACGTVVKDRKDAQRSGTKGGTTTNASGGGPEVGQPERLGLKAVRHHEHWIKKKGSP